VIEPEARREAGPGRPRFTKIRPDASEQIARELRAYVERSGLQPGERVGTEH
jgi:hypothetical protein